MFVRSKRRLPLAAGLGAALAVAATVPAVALGHDQGAQTTTPIKHLVVIFQENVSFDHYFATYPNAANAAGEPRFTAAPGTPSVNGLNTPLAAPNNPNSAQPFRLGRDQAQTCDQDHSYTDEQKAVDGGLMDKVVETVGRGDASCADYGHGKGLVMGYYDGNTVTGLWNYAQQYAMSDNSYGTTYGPSSPGAVNLVSGQTHGFSADGDAVPAASGTMIGDPQPAGDKCDTRDSSTATDSKNKNVGDLLNAKGVSWGWFQGGFADCTAKHSDVGGVSSVDYIPHHEPFQYYKSTQNLQHTPPASVDEIGNNGPANHQYDLKDFWASVDNGSMPAVSYLKAAAYQDGHAGYSTPLDEQHFVVDTVNRLQKSKDWKNTAVVVAYDDSDGWYDHQVGPVVNQSNDPQHDALTGTNCGTNPARIAGGYQDRCGYGPRLPLLVISPYAKQNFVDHTTTDQTSVLKFVEDNWNTGPIGNFSFDEKAGSMDNLFDFHHKNKELLLDPVSGQPVKHLTLDGSAQGGVRRDQGAPLGRQ